MRGFGQRKNRNQKEDKVVLSKDSYKKALRIFAFLKPYAVTFTIGSLFLLLSSLGFMIFPYFMGSLFDPSAVKNPDNVELFKTDNINSIFLSLLVLFGSLAAFSFMRIFLFSISTEKALANLRQEAYKHIISLPLNFFNTNKVGQLNSRLSSDVTLLQETFNTTLPEFFRQFITIAASLFFLFFISWPLALTMLGTVPVIALAAVFFGRYIKKLSKKSQEEIAISNGIVEETLTGIANVKAFTNEAFEVLRYRKSTDKVKGLSIKTGIWRGGLVSFIIFAFFGVISFILWRGAKTLPPQELFQFVIYSIFVGASIGSLPDLYAKIQKAIGATEHLMDILDAVPENINTEESGQALKLKGAVEFNKVIFNYPSRPDIPVLKGINFSVDPGEQIALVGPSGAGKSTIAQLVLKFFSPKSGKILFDDVEIKNESLTDLRKNIAIVPQEVILFGGSIQENIAYGKPTASFEEIKSAAEQANAMEFIKGFPDGFDTLVGDRGVQLSGGQKQRIAIARAILKNPSILILDEATSALDSESERLVQNALERLMKNRTSIVIAHRLSTIKNADRILVLENGEIKEEGKHDDLILKKDGLYARLSNLQLNLNSGVENIVD